MCQLWHWWVCASVNSSLSSSDPHGCEFTAGLSSFSQCNWQSWSLLTLSNCEINLNINLMTGGNNRKWKSNLHWEWNLGIFDFLFPQFLHMNNSTKKTAGREAMLLTTRSFLLPYTVLASTVLASFPSYKKIQCWKWQQAEWGLGNM